MDGDLRECVSWLRKHEGVVGATVPMPLRPGMKTPMFAHKNGAWGFVDFDTYVSEKKISSTDSWGLLLDRVIVIDCDSAEDVEWLDSFQWNGFSPERQLGNANGRRRMSCDGKQQRQQTDAVVVTPQQPHVYDQPSNDGDLHYMVFLL